MGIGQPALLHWRYSLVEYMPAMFVYDYVVQSKKPEAIASKNTLFYPFNKIVWYLVASSVFSVFLTLVLIQKCWMMASGEKPPSVWIYQGKKI